MHISAKADYAMRALLALASRQQGEEPARVRAEDLARSGGLPAKFVENILVELRRAGIVTSQRGGGGGYRLARPASAITPADVIRAMDGPLADVRGLRPEAATYQGSAEHLRDVWVAARAGLRSVLEGVSLADIVAGTLPEEIRSLTADPDAWKPR